MRISGSKWCLIFIYLIIFLPSGIFFASATTQILIKLFYFFFQGTTLGLSSIDYLKILKGSIAGGIVGAIGCWWIYYQHCRKNRNR
ncbi:hypothetical protein HA49_04670 [Tatumella morbirosei]|uniref:Uncharacterized protein n=1 Tax=Tatumella morbirosei TaxID=642227 RepID=A0A095TJN0_9GAMM|nr:hypothetical protein HA49_04670 [Tatumella morbirosei]